MLDKWKNMMIITKEQFEKILNNSNGGALNKL